MNAAIPLLVIGGTAAIGGIIWAANKTAAAEDLKISLGRVEFNPFKNIAGGTATAQLVFAVRNIRKASLTLEAIDLEIKVGGKTIAAIREFNNPKKITGITSTEVKLPAKGGIAQIILALGTGIVKTLGTSQKMPETERQSLLSRMMPKEVQVVGNMRAEGQVIAFDEVIALKV